MPRFLFLESLSKSSLLFTRYIFGSSAQQWNIKYILLLSERQESNSLCFGEEISFRWRLDWNMYRITNS